MRQYRIRCAIVCLCLPAMFVVSAGPARTEITSKKVTDSIERAKRFLIKAQQLDGDGGSGYWQAGNTGTFRVGITSLALLALMNSGSTPEEDAVRRGLKYLRGLSDGDVKYTYEVSLMIMALAAAKDKGRDAARVLNLVRKLEDSQIKNGQNAGTWNYMSGVGGALDGGGDRSNGQYAVLGLREAQELGVPVSLETWKRARAHWKLSQGPDGGWGYSGIGPQGSIGSMTVAGIATMVITEAMVRAEEKDLNPDGTPNCCGDQEPDKSVEDGVRWLGKNFSVGHNPHSNSWLLYYLYGLERAGRLSGRRFFGEGANKHDWYREGAEYLVDRQMRLNGSWSGVGSMESDPVVGTSFALLFLSKGNAPVLINKLDYPLRDAAGNKTAGDKGPDNNWNKHRDDVRNLTQLISNLPKWPKLLISQVVDLEQAGVSDLLQAPILFISGDQDPGFTAKDVALFKDYVAQGGLIFAERACKGEAFDLAFRDLVKQMYPQNEARLRQLTADHPIYRSEYLIEDPSTVELWGVDVGCRTSIIYSPHDFSCLWDKWTPFPTPKRSPQLTLMITKAVQVGVNIVAYATGREPASKLDQQGLVSVEGEQDKIQRGLMEIAKLRHTGGWDAAPQALHNLLVALNKSVGMAASTKARDLAVLDPNIFKYPMLYMHGRNAFQLNPQERERLHDYLTRGGVLFSDACCGSPQFDRSFRQLITQVFPNNSLKRIPPDHELFTSKIGHDLKRVKRREPDVNSPDAALKITVRTVEPFLEGIEIEGRFVVIYSKYDISCAMERQAAVTCTGYVHEDALRLAMNIVLYALLQ